MGGVFPTCPEMSRFVPVCPLLSRFVPRSGPQEGQKRTNGDKTGHFGTSWETPPFSIYPHLSEVNKRGRPSKWPPECLPSKFADFECAFSLYLLGEKIMILKDAFVEGTFWDKFWRPIRSRALLFTPEFSSPHRFLNT